MNDRLADSEIRLRPADRELRTSAAVYWEAGARHFVIVKTGHRRHRCRFRCRLHEQCGSGVDGYDNLGACAVSLLQAQADHERAHALGQHRAPD